MALWFNILCDYGIHGSQSGWAEEHVAALSADIGGDITQNIQFALPSVDVFHAARFYESSTERTLRHWDTLPRQ